MKNTNDIQITWHVGMTRQEISEILVKMSGLPIDVISSEYLYLIVQLLMDIRDQISLKKYD